MELADAVPIGISCSIFLKSFHLLIIALTKAYEVPHFAVSHLDLDCFLTSHILCKWCAKPILSEMINYTMRNYSFGDIPKFIIWRLKIKS